HALFSRKLLGQNPQPASATFVLEIWKANSPQKKTLPVAASLGVLENQVHIHRGKHADHQAFLEFGFNAEGLDLDTVEYRAREMATALGKVLPSIDPMFANAQITQLGWETSVQLTDEAPPQPKLSGHYILANTQAPLDCEQLLALEKEAKELIGSLPIDAAGSSRFGVLAIVGTTIPAQRVS